MYSFKVLHVTEAMGGGTESAILEFVAATGEVEHHLVYRARNESATGGGLEPFASAVAVRGGLLKLRKAIVREVRRIQPDIVHLHSSWAGLLGRTPRVFRSGAVVYSPHCYYFERQDIGPIKRFISARVEVALSHWTDVVVAVSPHEQSLARSLGVPETTFVRNLVRDWSPPAKPSPPATPLITTVGRVSRQKDPEFFEAVVEESRRLGVRANWLWIGGGDSLAVERLRRCGVAVTGWLDRELARSLLASSTLYLHTARWESGPVSIEEARLAEIPKVIRSIPSLVSLGYPDNLISPKDLAEEIYAQLADSALRRQEALADRVTQSDLDAQARALLDAYYRAHVLKHQRSSRTKECGQLCRREGRR